MPAETSELVAFVNEWGWPIATLAFVFIGLQRRWFVTGSEFNQVVADRDWWRNVATTSLQLGEKAAERAAEHSGNGTLERRLALLEDQVRQYRPHDG